MKLLIITLSLMLAGPAFAKNTTRAKSSHSYLRSFQPSWGLVVGYTRTGARINHTETSSLAGFSPLNGQSKIGNNNFSLTLLKEFMHKRRFSITTEIFGGGVNGKGSDLVGNTNYEGEAGGFQYGLSLSGNINFMAYGMKVQPFLGVGASVEDVEYRTLYERTEEITTNYQYSATMGEAAVGMRFLDEDVGMISFIKVAYLNPLSENIEATALIGNSEEVIQGGELLRDQVSATFGLGFLF